MAVYSYKRHTQECRVKHGWVHSPACDAINKGKKVKTGCSCPKPDKNFKRCDCPIWFESNEGGKQRRWSSKEANKEVADRKLRRAEAKGEPLVPGTNKTLEDAVTAFLENKRNKTTKRGTTPCADTLYRYEAVLDSLKAFCAAAKPPVRLLKDITLPDHIQKWQSTWKLKTMFAKRGRQEKVRNFFRYCVNHKFVSDNPLTHWEPVPLSNGDNAAISEDKIIRDKEYAKILRTIDEVDMTPENRIRIRACMRLQREFLVSPSLMP